jgi:PAS domain-containing protein
MLELTWNAWAGFVLICVFTATFAALWVTQAGRSKNRAALQSLQNAQAETAVLFQVDTLVDATPSAREMFENAEGDSDWQRLDALFRPRFSGFPQSGDALCKFGSGRIKASDPNDPAALIFTTWGDVTRIELTDLQSTPLKVADHHHLKLLERELETLRQAMDGAPYPVWQTDAENAVTWCNMAYTTLRQKISDSPLNPVFDVASERFLSAGKVRSSLSVPGTDQLYWFDISMVRFPEHRMFYAVDVNAVVNAEISQRNFVQTLAKTFAQLSIGLAIFDRNRQLVLFNPALIDLTALPADFLSARPNLLSFFDRLRDNRMMPEPKNYTTWREQIADLVAAAADGKYFENWSLPTGPTYRVSGRPHPDGAVAFLFEDITAEVSLTRRFRSELELGQSLLDAIDDAVVVFSSTGLLTMSNLAYRELWGIDPDSSFVDMTVLDSIRHWQSNCEATPILSEIRDYVLEYSERAEWDALIRTKSGIDLTCRVHPVTAGATLVRFLTVPPGPAKPVLSAKKLVKS